MKAEENIHSETTTQGSTASPAGMKLDAFPVQIIEHNGDVVIKRGRVEFVVSGLAAKEIVKSVFELLTTEARTREDLTNAFPDVFRQNVDDLIDRLLERQFLRWETASGKKVAAGESGQDVFYWHFGSTEQRVRNNIAGKQIALIGMNAITKQCATRLSEEADVALTIVDAPGLRSPASPKWNSLSEQIAAKGVLRTDEAGISDGEFDIVVATCETGGHKSIREWNRYCIARKVPFLPVLLFDLVGYVGPFVIPGETACFECLQLRQDSHMSNPALERLTQNIQDPMMQGFHPSLTTMLGEIAAVELTRFCGLGWPWWDVGNLIEVNLLAMSMNTRKVLKLPRCPVCGRGNLQAPSR